MLAHKPSRRVCTHSHERYADPEQLVISHVVHALAALPPGGGFESSLQPQAGPTQRQQLVKWVRTRVGSSWCISANAMVYLGKCGIRAWLAASFFSVLPNLLQTKDQVLLRAGFGLLGVFARAANAKASGNPGKTGAMGALRAPPRAQPCGPGPTITRCQVVAQAHKAQSQQRTGKCDYGVLRPSYY